MARIGDTFLIQRVGMDLVFMDEATGEEVTIGCGFAGEVAGIVAYLASPEDPGSVLDRGRALLRA